MDKSLVACVKVKEGEGNVQKAVARAMNLASWTTHVKGNSIFIKINTMSFPLVPGTNTSPWVIEGLIKEIKEKRENVKIYFGDAEIVGAKNVEKAGINWGYYKIAEKYGVEFVNLSKEKLIEVDLAGTAISRVKLPERLLKVDSIITVPVMKSHALSVMTAAMKNQWGCLPLFRHNFHPVLHQAIVDINAYLKPSFAVIDGTISMEGKGPRVGSLKICDIILASDDLVAVDSAVKTYMGYAINENHYINLAHEQNLGNRNFEIAGDEFVANPFKPARSGMLTLIHKKLRSSFLSNMLFKTNIVNILAKGALVYNTYIWYYLFGRKMRRDILKNSWYSSQFTNLP